MFCLVIVDCYIIITINITRYADKFNNSQAPRTPNFNPTTNVDKHAVVTANPRLNSTAIAWIDELYKDRLRSLLSVDDMIGDLIDYLTKNNLLNITYIIYTSDHGYHLGQWRIPCSKEQMYETDIKIPMFIRGPNIAFKSTAGQLVCNIDILPTVADLANIPFPDASVIDGKSMVGHILPEYNYNDGYGSGTNDDNSSINFKMKKATKLEKMREILRVDTTWRQVFLSEYRSTGTLYFDHCSTWWIGNSTQNGDGHVYGFPGIVINPPPNDFNGVPWYIDNRTTNNWRMLRIINSTSNIAYGEFIDYSWNKESKENPMYYELYDMNNDFYQMNNLYPSYSKNNSMKGYLSELHDMLMSMGECTGADCFV